MTAAPDAAPGKTRQPRRSRAGADRVQRLAAAVELLESHRDRVLELRDRADGLHATDLMVVDGEMDVLTALEGHLGTARSLLAQLRADPEDTGALSRFEDVVSPSRWSAVDVVEDHLQRKEQILAAARIDVQARLGPWADCESETQQIDRELAEINAVLPRDVSEGRDGMLSLVNGVRKALDAAQLMLAHTLLRRLEQPPTDTAGGHHAAAAATPGGRVAVVPVPSGQVTARMQEELASMRQRAGRVQLTVLRGPLDEGRYDYTLMLLAPGGDGHVGVNIQDTSTIVEQDRRYFLDVIHRAGGAAYSGLRQSIPAMRDATAPQDSGQAARTVTDLRAMGAVLYRLLLPDRMKDELARHPRAQLIVTTNDLELPWELMFDGDPLESPDRTTETASAADDTAAGAGQFLSLRRPVARMPVGRSRGRSSLRLQERRSATRRIALIASVGQPPLTDVTREVTRIKERMEQDWPKVVQIEVLATGEKQAPVGERFRDVLMSRDYDIVHFAGHAAYDVRRPDQSSLLLDGGEVCFAQKIQRLLAGHPLVFLNACETARLTAADGRPPVEGTYEGDPKEGLASAFVYGGALGCIGATWPVRDEVAAEFAVAFYNMVLEGRSLGQSILEARTQTASTFPDDPSWAAFVLYGDPSFRWPALTPG